MPLSMTQRLRVFVVAGGFVVCGTGCPPHDGDAKDLAVWSTSEARKLIENSLADLERGDVDVVVARFCDVSADGLRRARAVVGPAAGKTGLRVRRIEPAWVGKEPFFYVEVGEHDVGLGDGWVHGLAVRVRDGCIDRAVGASDFTAPPAIAPQN